MIIPSVNYHWFYSALSQSLAALIGIIGMFIVYRLQIQENSIYEALRILQRSMSIGEPEYMFHYNEKETIVEAETRIRNLEEETKRLEGLNNGLDEDFGNGKVGQSIYAGAKENNSGLIKSNAQEIVRFKNRITNIFKGKNKKKEIRRSALVTILYLVVLFFTSLIGLIYSDYFSQNIYCADIFIGGTVFYLLGGLYFLVRCCTVSLY